MIAKLCTAIAAGLIAGSASATLALASDRETRQVEVPLTNLDLRTQAGVDRLKRRLRTAARQACGPMERSTLEEHVSVSRCIAGAIASATPELQAAVLAARSTSPRMPGRSAVVAMTITPPATTSAGPA